ncbi:MAG: glycosyl hydrolase 115 family protein, partial [Pirellulales bacterium]
MPKLEASRWRRAGHQYGLSVLLLCALLRSQVLAADNVTGNLINFDNDGYWSWYMDERTIIDPANGKLLVGSVSGSPVRYPIGRPTGSVDVVSFDFATGNRTRSQLSDIDEDDHNAPGLIILPDGRYLAMYSNHGNTGMGDYLSRYRLSSNQGATWTAEQSFNWQSVTGWNTAPNANNRVSYHNLYYLSADNAGAGRLYNFSRATHQSANALVFNPTTNTWSWGGQLTESATGGYSTGYIKYASNNVDRIYFMSTETHPRNYNNNVYAGYVSDGVSYDMQGNVIDANLFNNDDTAGNGAVPDITSFSKIFQADAAGPGNVHTRAWTVDLSLGPDGNPCGLFTTRWKDDDPLGNGEGVYGANQEKDNNGYYHHTLWYAKYDGSQWHVNPVAQMGQMMYLAEEDYTGLGAINPKDPNTIYVSTPLDPRTAVEPPLTPGGPSPTPSPTDYSWNPTYQVQGGQHEIYKGVTHDNGATWAWTPITQNSVVDNFRPIIPSWDTDNTAVVWFRGTYTTAHDTDAAIVGILDRNHEQLGPIHYVDATTSNTTRASGTGAWSSGPSDAEAGASATDNLWHWRTGTGNNGDVLAAGATNTTATENAPLVMTTLTGLADGVYDVFAYFWANPGQDWRLQAGFAANDLMLFRDNGAQQAEEAQFDPNDPTVLLTAASGSALYRAYVGRKEVVDGAAIDVFIDDFMTSTTTAGANRAWYDGLGYGLVSTIIDELAGDFNGDLVVDVADYTLWRDNLGAADESAIGGNGDGLNGVDESDYEIWKSHFGESLAAGSGARQVVPEPATLPLVALAGTLVSLARSRRRTASFGALVLLLVGVAPVHAVGTTSYITSNPSAGRFNLSTATEAAPLLLDSSDHAGVLRVAKHLQADIENVTGHEPQLVIGEQPAGRDVVLIGTLGKNATIDRLVAEKKLDVAEIAGEWEAFLATVVDRPVEGADRALVIVGSDKRGTIYGMYDLAAQIGVSPWHWWADVPVKKQPTLSVLPGRHVQPSPKVKYRGIFINDEAPALAGWMQDKFGGHNHKFYDHVYQLILRLKGNYLWPAMWGRSLYDDDPESPRLADEYGIVIGTSHHEPMMRAHVEWERYGKGPWNYDANEAKLREFWTAGVRRMGANESVVTVGMRGDGDEPMSETANIALLERIVADQRGIIAEVTGKDPAQVPQMWALYKEVQKYYDRGMRVPDDVTLLLCDDNWGNIRKLPKVGEKPRAGGYGIYYHFDYVGGPRNYKWLNTNSIPRVWEQMHLANEYGVDRLWIVNVGDIKPMELPTEFFLDYAWNPDAWP